MKSREFIKTKLNELYTKFSDIRIRYEYRANTYSHLIEIIPFNFFEENEEYITIESKIEEDFENMFPNENILFISDGSLTEIINPEFRLGYDDTIKFNNDVLNIDYIVDGFNDGLDFQYSNNYALAS